MPIKAVRSGPPNATFLVTLAAPRTSLPVLVLPSRFTMVDDLILPDRADTLSLADEITFGARLTNALPAFAAIGATFFARNPPAARSKMPSPISILSAVPIRA